MHDPDLAHEILLRAQEVLVEIAESDSPDERLFYLLYEIDRYMEIE